ncbi:MAG: signal peptidase I [Myxococcota bacterium]
MSRKKQSGADRAESKKRRKRETDDAAATELDGEELSPLAKFWEQVGPIFFAILIALGIRAVIIESYYVPSGSMLPTMYIGDHVFVSKFAYGARIPILDIPLPAVREPERGEIVVFHLGRGGEKERGRICPLDECPDFSAEGFVKRIVGLPGDTVEYRSGKLFLNGSPAEQVLQPKTFSDDRGEAHRLLTEDLDGCVHEILDHPRRPGLTQAPLTIPEDRYFVLGDNRDNSNDSRGWGTVHRMHLKGPVLINYWAWNNTYSWLAMLNPWTWIKLLWGEMYWDRIGMTYDCRG